MKYEVCRSNTVRVIALQQSVDRRTDGPTDRQIDKVITIGLPHLRWRGPNKYIDIYYSEFAGTFQHNRFRQVYGLVKFQFRQVTL